MRPLYRTKADTAASVGVVCVTSMCWKLKLLDIVLFVGHCAGLVYLKSSRAVQHNPDWLPPSTHNGKLQCSSLHISLSKHSLECKQCNHFIPLVDKRNPWSWDCRPSLVLLAGCSVLTHVIDLRTNIYLLSAIHGPSFKMTTLLPPEKRIIT